MLEVSDYLLKDPLLFPPVLAVSCLSQQFSFPTDSVSLSFVPRLLAVFKFPVTTPASFSHSMFLDLDLIALILCCFVQLASISLGLYDSPTLNSPALL